MATVRNWVGGRHDFFAANSWTPPGRPVAGDTAVVGLGSASDPNVAVARNAALNGLAIVLDDGLSAPDPADNPTLSLSNVVIAGDTSIAGHATFAYNPNPFAETLDLAGLVLNQGTISENDLFNTLNVDLAPNTLMMNLGTISGGDFDTIAVADHGRARLLNDGTISGQGSSIDIGAPVSGHGSFSMTDSHGFNSDSPNSSRLEFHQDVGRGETISMTGSLLVLDAPLTFLATIDDLHVASRSLGQFARNSAVILNGEQATGLAFQDNVLTVLDGDVALAHLRFTPGLTADDFTFNAIPGGAGLPASTAIHIEQPATGVASTAMADTTAMSAPVLQTHA